MKNESRSGLNQPPVQEEFLETPFPAVLHDTSGRCRKVMWV